MARRAAKPPARKPEARKAAAALDDAGLEALVAEARRIQLRRKYKEARRLLDQALAARPGHFGALMERGRLFAGVHYNFARAKADFEAAAAAAPERLGAVVALGDLQLQTGRRAEAIETAEAALARDEACAGAWAILAAAAPEQVDDARLGRLRALAEAGGQPPRSERKLWASLGQLLDRRDEVDGAFAAFARANALAERLHARPYRPQDLEARLRAMETTLTPAFFRARADFGVRSRRMAFVIGLPRCGSTLLEQVVVAHPDADSAGESTALGEVELQLRARVGLDPRGFDRAAILARLSKADAQAGANLYRTEIAAHLSKKSATKTLDKALNNFLRAPTIKLLTPNAVMAHLFRHPLDTLWSCYKQEFEVAAFTARFDHLAHYFQMYRAHLALWERLFPDSLAPICYEDFVADFGRVAPKALAALGLDWRADCASAHRSDRVVRTASAGQVQEPVHTRAIQSWRRYERHLAPLIEAVGGRAALEAAYEAQRAKALS